MNSFKKDFASFIKRYSFMVPLLVVTVLAFGFQVTNFTYGIDSIARDEYLFGGRSIAQGRLALPLLAPLLNLSELFPFAEEFFGVVALLFGTISFCVAFKRASHDKLNKHFYTAFACLFVTYPIITEYWVYAMMGWEMSIGYTMIAFSLMQMMNFFNDKKIWRILLSSLMLALTVSIYEALLPVYVMSVFMILLLRFIFGEDEDRKFKHFALNGLFMAIPLIIGMLFEFFVAWVLTKVMTLPPSLGASTGITYKSLGLIGGLERAFLGIYENFIASAVWYMPITILWIALFVFLAITIVLIIRNKKPVFLVLAFGCLFSLLLLTFIQGSVSPYRCCQVFSLFTAFTFALLLHYALQMPKFKLIKYTCSTLVVFLCFIQGVETNNWFALNHQRFEAEMRILEHVGYELITEYDTKKPIVFMGQKLLYNDRLTDHVYLDRQTQLKYLEDTGYMRKIAQTSVGSMLGWSMTAFSQPGTELYKIFEYIGYDFVRCTNEMFNEARELCKDMPEYPHDGYIQDFGEYIIVRLDTRAVGKVPET